MECPRKSKVGMEQLFALQWFLFSLDLHCFIFNLQLIFFPLLLIGRKTCDEEKNYEVEIDFFPKCQAMERSDSRVKTKDIWRLRKEVFFWDLGQKENLLSSVFVCLNGKRERKSKGFFLFSSFSRCHSNRSWWWDSIYLKISFTVQRKRTFTQLTSLFNFNSSKFITYTWDYPFEERQSKLSNLTDISSPMHTIAHPYKPNFLLRSKLVVDQR